jgi:hypothetical protein
MGVGCGAGGAGEDRVYGGWWQPTLHTRARDVLERSAARYIEFLRGEAAVD